MTSVSGISHITLICKNLDKTTEFLQQIFSAKEIYASGNNTFSLSKEKFFKIGHLWLAIMEGEPVSKTYNHIAFQVNVSDLSTFREKISQLCLEILPDRKRHPDEGQSLYFYDYDGHLFELHSGSLEKRLQYYNK